VISKKELLDYLNAHFIQEIEEVKGELELIHRDLANDTKSSAGDKFETSREMAQQEIEKLQRVLKDKIRLGQIIKTDSYIQTNVQVKAGSLAYILDVNSQIGVWYLFGLPIGKIQFMDQNILGIGLTAPFAQAFLVKTKNDNVHFNRNEFLIVSIE
jgi:hypothetical protein